MKSLKERHCRKWWKFWHNDLKVRQQGKEVLISDLVEKALYKHKSTSSKGISRSSKKKLRRMGMIIEQSNVPRKSETGLSSVSLNRTVEDQATF